MAFAWDFDTWKTIDCYFRQDHILTQHQLESFNNLVDFVIPQIIEKNNPLRIATDFQPSTGKFGKILVMHFMQTYLTKPLIHENNDIIKPLYPNEARLRGLTYAANMYIDIKYQLTVDGKPGDWITEYKIPFLKLPVMLHSRYCHLSDHTEHSLRELGECQYDQGGYFIVNGGEKVIVSQERVAENQVFVWNPSKNPANAYTHEAEVKSAIDQRFYPIKSNKVVLTKEPSTRNAKKMASLGGVVGRTLRVIMPYIKGEIPLFVMFRALGIGTEREMFEMIMPDMDSIGSNYVNFLIPSIDEARTLNVLTQDDALAYLAQKINVSFIESFEKQNTECKIKYVVEVISRELFPHLGQMASDIGQSFRKKAFYLGYMTRKLIDCYFGVRPFDDRDHYGNKRVDLAGPLLTALFRVSFIKLIRDLRQQILSGLSSSGTPVDGALIRKIIMSCNIESKIKYGLATGNWNTQKGGTSSSKKGIAQVLNRLSEPGALSHTRRIQSPLERSGSKIVPPRCLHGTHFGMCCPNESPEGAQIGITKNLALQTHITIQTSDYMVRVILSKLGMTDINEVVAKDVAQMTKVFVNGDWCGTISDCLIAGSQETYAHRLYRHLKTLKRHGVIVPYISIAWFIEWREIRIQTDGGRYSRPVYAVGSDGKLLIKELYDHNAIFRQKMADRSVAWTQFLSGFHEGTKFDQSKATMDNGGVVEYIDTNETECSKIAMTYKDLVTETDPSKEYYNICTHCEIHPMMMMSVIAVNICFSDHNQTARNCFQCLDKNEEVIMADGSRKKISEIRVGDEVITVDPVTLEQKPTKVINQYVKPTEKKIIELTLLSGRTITCTEDHPILTYNGWKSSGSLTKEDLVCVCPTTTFYPLDKMDLVIDGNKFKQVLKDRGLKDSLIEKHHSKLTSLGLLPLYQNSQHIPILARIFGFCMTDGSIGIYSRGPQMSMVFGLAESGEEYLKDVVKMGFDKNRMAETEGVVRDMVHHGWQVIYNNELVSLIISLGIPLGKRTETAFSHVPDWIKYGSQQVKREFLAGFQGGDGCKIRCDPLKGRKSPCFILNVTTLSKCAQHTESLKTYLTEIKQLFAEFGINCKDVTIHKDKHHDDRYCVGLPFECSRENIINYFERIGYKYDLYKYRDSLPVYEYLKYHQLLAKQVDNRKKQITELRSQGLMFTDIGIKLGLSPTKCADLYRSASHSKASRIPNEYMTIDTWLTTIKLANNSIFVPVNSVVPHENVEIADITTESESHSFITGHQICVHNSAMAKQAIGFYATNYNSRMDSLANVIVYGQQPLVTTQLAKYTILDKLPHGATSMLLYACFTGYNQEDSLILNRDAVERGFFNTVFFRTYSAEAQKHRSATTTTEYFTKPEGESRDHQQSRAYDAIDANGIPVVGRMVKGGDVIIGKMIETKVDEKPKDVSITTRAGETGYIDKVIPDHNGAILPFNGDGHRIVKARVAVCRQPEIGDKFACFDDKTQVLTNQGWKFFKDLILSDQVACLENGNLVYSHPTELQSYQVNNQMMYTIETQQINLKVTPNHRMYVKKRDSVNFMIDEAQNLFNQRLKFKKNCQYTPSNWCGDKFVFPEETRKRGREYEKLDKYVINMDHWLIFLGIWIAEGWTDVRAGCDHGYISIAANKPRVKSALEQLETDLGWHFTKCESSEKWKLSHIKVYQYLQQLSVGATNKYLPDWVWQLNQNQAKLLLNSMCLGDGYKTTSNTQLYYTSSTQLANDIQRLALHAGLSANIRVRSESGTPYQIKGHNGVTTATSYYITIVKSKNEPQINHGHVPEKQDKWEQYTGQVYCCTVPSGIIYVRREGIPEWLGNSRYSQKGTTGILYPSINMPFTATGLVPDMIMNPHGIPSRMTIGKLLETLLGKEAVATGKGQDATPFTHFDLSTHIETLKKYGLDPLGNEVMYNGQTGQMFDATFFYGPTYYQRLKHMVDDKIHCLTMDHEVLTSLGWRRFEELDMNSMVATLHDGVLVYEKPLKLLHYPDYNGPLYEQVKGGVRLRTTLNHRMWVARGGPCELAKVDDILSEKVKYQRSAKNGSHAQHSHIEMTDLLTLFAHWITSGWVQFDTIEPNEEIHFKETPQLRRVLSDMGYQCESPTTGPVGELVIKDTELKSYLSQYSIYRGFPSWIWELSTAQSQHLLMSITRDQMTYTTRSVQLVDDLQRLAIQAEWSAIIEPSLEDSATWIVTIDKEPFVEFDPADAVVMVEAREPVFCLQVSTEVFYVRRHGHCCWTGNSRESGPVQLLTRQPAEGRSRDGGLRAGEMERDCFIAHGVTKFLKERFMDSSDLFRVYVSKKEECLIVGNPEKHLYKLGSQQIKDDEVFQTQIPYAMKLLLQELESMGLDIRLGVS